MSEIKNMRKSPFIKLTVTQFGIARLINIINRHYENTEDITAYNRRLICLWQPGKKMCQKGSCR